MNLLAELRRLENTIVFDEFSGDPAIRHDLGRVSFTILDTVLAQGRVRPSQIAEILRMSRPAVSRALRKLSARGLVSTSTDQIDGRATAVRITAAGRRAIARFEAIETESIELIFAPWSGSERDQLAAALARLNDRVDEVYTQLRAGRIGQPDEQMRKAAVNG